MRSERLYRLLDPEASGQARTYRGIHHAMVATGIGIMIANTEADWRLAWRVELAQNALHINRVRAQFEMAARRIDHVRRRHLACVRYGRRLIRGPNKILEGSKPESQAGKRLALFI